MTRASGSLGFSAREQMSALGQYQKLTAPAGFAYDRTIFPFNFWRDATGRPQTDFDRRVIAPTPDVTPWATVNTYYVKAAGGSDGNSGATWALAKATINGAITAGNTAAAPFIVYVQAGTYVRTSGFNGVVPTQPCSFIAVGGKVVTGTFDALTYALDTGTTYSVARSNVKRVFNLLNQDSDGLYFELTLAASLAACRATLGTWYTDGTTLYVNRMDGAAVTAANTRACLTAANCVFMSTGGHMYMSGFEIWGGDQGAVSLKNAPSYSFVAEDCTFSYSTNSAGQQNCASVLDIKVAAFIRCMARGGQNDGFNSHANAGNQAFMYTQDCIGIGNGRPGGNTSCNGWTLHDGGKAIDFRGTYRRNYGASVAVVHANTVAWCIGALVSDSYGDVVNGGPTPAGVDFLTDQSTPALYLDNCSGQDVLNLSGTLAVRGGLFSGVKTGVTAY